MGQTAPLSDVTVVASIPAPYPPHDDTYLVSRAEFPAIRISNVREWIELASQGIQDLAVFIIVVSIIYGSVRFLLQFLRRVADPYPAYKKLLGRSLLLSLEFLIAADVIRTILLDETAKSVGILGGLVLVRTFLSWSVVVEIEGHWPWQSAAAAAEREDAGVVEARKPVYASAGRT